MIGEYGKDKESKLQRFEATAILRPKSTKKVWSGRGLIDTVSVHTDGVSLHSEEDPSERRAGFQPAFRLVPGKKYLVTVQEIES